jgi:hypothetical protein
METHSLFKPTYLCRIRVTYAHFITMQSRASPLYQPLNPLSDFHKILRHNKPFQSLALLTLCKHKISNQKRTGRHRLLTPKLSGNYDVESTSLLLR